MGHSFELKFHHGAFSVPDIEAAIDWYGRMLGFELEKRDTLAHVPAKVAFLKRGPMRLELFEVPDAIPREEARKNPHEDLKRNGIKHVCFEVRDARAVAEELKRRGADIVFCRDVHDMWVLFVRDMAGNLIEFLEEPKERSAF